jgi:hypothetical protein
MDANFSTAGEDNNTTLSSTKVSYHLEDLIKREYQTITAGIFVYIS